jgi:hypothetical protein
MSVQRQIKLVDRYRSLSTGGGGGSGPGGPGGGKGGSATKPTTAERTGFRKTKDDAGYQDELARRRAAKQAEARHLDNLRAHPPGKGACNPLP